MDIRFHYIFEHYIWTQPDLAQQMLKYMCDIRIAVSRSHHWYTYDEQFRLRRVSNQGMFWGDKHPINQLISCHSKALVLYFNITTSLERQMIVYVYWTYNSAKLLSLYGLCLWPEDDMLSVFVNMNRLFYIWKIFFCRKLLI